MKQGVLKKEENIYSNKTIEIYNILNDYINSNLSPKNDFENTLNELKKLSKFDKIDYNNDVLDLLFQNNTILFNIIRKAIISNFYKIRENKIFDVIDNKFVLALIDFYQVLYPNDIQKIELFLRASNGDKIARNKIILDNKGIVYELAFKYNFDDNIVDDLISEGMIALIKAVDNFKLSKNVEFSTYTFNCVEGAIKRFINTKEGDVKVNLAEKLVNYNKNIKLLEEKLGKQPSFDEIAKEFRMNKPDISMFNSLKDNFISLNSFVADDSEKLTEIGDLIPDTPEKFIDSNVDDQKLLLYKLLYSSNLSISCIYVLIYHYGLEEFNRLTFEKIGKTVALKPNAIDRLEKNALKKIRTRISNNNYTEEKFSNNALETNYNTLKIFDINNRVLRNMPIPMLNMIVNNIIYYNLFNSYLLDKKKQKDNEIIKFSNIDNRVLDIISSYILEYDKLFIYDALMDLSLDEIKFIYLNYSEKTNPKHLFVNENFNNNAKNQFIELFIKVIKKIKEVNLIYDDFYKYFSKYTIEQIERITGELSEEEKKLLHLRFGEGLKNNVIYPLTDVQRYGLEKTVKKIKRFIMSK